MAVVVEDLLRGRRPRFLAGAAGGDGERSELSDGGSRFPRRGGESCGGGVETSAKNSMPAWKRARTHARERGSGVCGERWGGWG